MKTKSNMTEIKQNEDVLKKLSDLGYKIDFWYEKGHLDAVCVAQWIGQDLIWQKTYKVEEIARILFNDFITNSKQK
jgi:hypothetical protein